MKKSIVFPLLICLVILYSCRKPVFENESNHLTLWYNNPTSLEYLPVLQKALFENLFKEAWQLAQDHLLGTPPQIRSYQPLRLLSREDYLSVEVRLVGAVPGSLICAPVVVLYLT